MTVRDFDDLNGKHPLFVEHLNEVVSHVNEVHDMDATWPLIMSKAQSFSISLAMEIPRFERMRVKQEFNNYLRCRLWNGTADGADEVYVAKPWKLRHVLANYPNLTGLTTNAANEVEATDGVDTETWLVTPDYDANDEILALYVGTTGVAGTGGLTDIGWIDTNRDGRVWAVEPA
jgi:hypothetical protein